MQNLTNRWGGRGTDTLPGMAEDDDRTAHPDVPPEAWAGVHRGPLRPGEWVRLTDQKGRRHNFELVPGKRFFSNRGHLDHDELIGREEGFTVPSFAGGEYLVFRPLLSEFVVSMPRGAAVVYPKDAAQIVAMADIFPGADVVEAGVGSGALTCSLLRAVGPHGTVTSYERREEFADVARRNVNQFFGGAGGRSHPAWRLKLGDLSHELPASGARADRIILDMLAPWECLDAAAGALRAGGIVCAYVATTTQLSRFVESLRVHGGFTEPQAWESLVRDWHVEGLAVRPGHAMIGHTAFLVTARRMAQGERPPSRKRRPAPGAYGPDYQGPRPPDVPEEAAPA
jgi:tRNA (adenine57-N1/adenine58-N1)-methyltransferase catalytic subunit